MFRCDTLWTRLHLREKRDERRAPRLLALRGTVARGSAARTRCRYRSSGVLQRLPRGSGVDRWAGARRLLPVAPCVGASRARPRRLVEKRNGVPAAGAVASLRALA